MCIHSDQIKICSPLPRHITVATVRAHVSLPLKGVRFDLTVIKSNETTDGADTLELRVLGVAREFVTLVGLLVVVAPLLYCLYLFLPHAAPVALGAVTPLPKFADAMRPEPAERFVFLASSAIIGLLAVAMALAPTWRGPAWGRQSPVAVSLAIYVGWTALVMVGLARVDFGPSLLYGDAALRDGSGWLLPAIWGAAVAWLAVGVFLPRRGMHALATWIPVCLFIAAMGLQIVAWRLPGEAAVEPTIAWSIHWDAMVYAIAQVAAGRTLLVDLPSQYGLYPEIIGAAFRFTTFSVLKLSVVFAVMQVLSLSAIFYVVLKWTRYGVFRTAFALAFILVTFETVLKINGMPEFYFQYWPLRFFWPALSVLMLHAYVLRPTLARAAAMSLCAGIGTVWNLETGIMIVGAFAALLGAKAVMRSTRSAVTGHAGARHEVQALLLHLLIVSGVIAAAAAYFLAAAPAPHWEWLFVYPNVFYRLGLNMIPLPLSFTAPWMSVLAVYLFGVVFAFAHWRRTSSSRLPDLIFYLSVLGWGLFVYYQGRSHILNLITVSWPALVIATILADRTLRLVRNGRLGRVHLAMPALALAVLLFCAGPLIANAVPLLRDARERVSLDERVASPLVADELAFIRQHTRPGDACVVLAQRQGFYLAAAGLGSPLRGPGYVEMLTVEDRDDMLAQLAQGRYACVFVGEGADTALDLNIDLATGLRHYTLLARSAGRSMALLAFEDRSAGQGQLPGKGCRALTDAGHQPSANTFGDPLSCAHD